MSISEAVGAAAPSSHSHSRIGAVAGLVTLAIGVVVNIAWDVSVLFAMLRMAFSD